MTITAIVRSALFACCALSATPSSADGVSQEQADAILRELQQIRQLLERMEQRDQSAPGNLNQRPGVRANRSTASVSTDRRPATGASDAPVTLVEFTDYQCPYCKRFFTDVYPQLKRDYIDSGKLRHVVKMLPLAIHDNARAAAQAALCAGEQGRYWDMHDKLFANASRLSEGFLKDYARQLGLEFEPFEACLVEQRHAALIEADLAEAARLGVRGTPTFVIGTSSEDIIDGTRIVGARPVAAFTVEIDRLLGGVD